MACGCLQAFKLVPNATELYTGVVRIDVPLVLATLSHLLKPLCALHARGQAHGEINDAMVLVSMRRVRNVGESWTLGQDVDVCICPPAPRAVVPATVSDLASIRTDLPLFYAPERFSDDCSLRSAAATAAADVWAVGMLLLFMLHHSLPLSSRTPMVCCSLPPNKL